MAQIISATEEANTTELVKQNDLTHVCAIHTCSESVKDKFREVTHHYCDVFTKNMLAPLPETVFVNGVQYEVNKKDRILIKSYDGKLNLWQNAPTFKSDIYYAANTVILDAAGKVVSVVTGSKDGRYAIACFDGLSGKFETTHDWVTVCGMSGIIYGNKTFKSREELKEYLKGRKLGNEVDLQAILVVAPIPRIILFDLISGLEVSHTYVRGMFDVRVCDKYHDGECVAE